MHTRFDRRHNNLDLLRLAFAGLVVTSHGIVMHTGDQPQWGITTLGDFGVAGFFVLSGFLVTRSYLGLRSLPRFAWHRFLRIMPGFWVCLLVVAFVAAPLAAVLQGLPARAPFTGDPSAVRYVFANASLLIRQWDIAGLLANNPNGTAFNGSLWTLAPEAGCYVLVALLGLLGVLRGHRWMVTVLGGVLAGAVVLDEASVIVLNEFLGLAFLFVLGMLSFLYASHIPMRGYIALGAAAVFVLSVALFEDYRVLGAMPLAYLVLWLGSSRWPTWSPRHDLSYGAYIYHWPALQLLMLTGAANLPTPAFVVLGLMVAIPSAALSWFVVERPALARKRSALPDRVANLLTRLLRRRRLSFGRTQA